MDNRTRANTLEKNKEGKMINSIQWTPIYYNLKSNVRTDFASA